MYACLFAYNLRLLILKALYHLRLPIRRMHASETETELLHQFTSTEVDIREEPT